jgi:hypothetical protein
MSHFLQSNLVGQDRSWLAMALGKAAELVVADAKSGANESGASAGREPGARIAPGHPPHSTSPEWSPHSPSTTAH